jgi:hypothetical protein
VIDGPEDVDGFGHHFGCVLMVVHGCSACWVLFGGSDNDLVDVDGWGLSEGEQDGSGDVFEGEWAHRKHWNRNWRYRRVTAVVLRR